MTPGALQRSYDPSTCQTYYVEIAGRGIVRAARVLSSEPSPGGWRAVEQGRGTETGRGHRWFELRFGSPPGSVVRVREILAQAGIPREVVLRVEPVRPGGGQALSRQLALFGGEA